MLARARFFLSLALLVLLLSPGRVSAMCATAEEMDAFNARVLQSELMVAALSCGEEKRYNRFVKRFREDLSQSARKMKQYFSRNYPSAPEASLNRFMTSLANKASSRSMGSSRRAYCSQSTRMFEQALAAPKGQLAHQAGGETASLHGIRQCGWKSGLKKLFGKD